MKKIYLLSLLFACALSVGSLSAKKTEMRLTQALPDDAWQQSVWLSATDAPVVTDMVNEMVIRAADGASWFVADIKNDKKVARAEWMTTGLGVYEIYVNGQAVGCEFLKPGYTHYQKTRRSFTYDITGGINRKAGAVNRLSAQVTPGWWADKIISPSAMIGMCGKKPAFRAVLKLTFTDGTTRLYGTNTTDWTAGIAGPVRHAAIYDGEEYDARIAPGYDTPERLSTPEINEEFNGDILPTRGAEVYLRYDLAMNPKRAYVWSGIEQANEEAYGKVIITREYPAGSPMIIRPGETLVVDFGQNAAAIPSFRFIAKEGTTLTCLPAELLNDSLGAKSRGMDGPEGSVHRQNLRVHETGMLLKYTFADSKKAVDYHPTRSFYGYRFVSITATDEVEITSLQSIPVSSITESLETGTIITGHADVNRLIQNTLWGQRSNYLSVPTDCPQRNERLGWTADTQVYAETGSFFANTASFFHKWMRDMRDSQSPEGSFPGVAPWGQYGREMMRIGWADAGIIVPWTVWKQFSDTAIIGENWEAMDKFMQHVNDTKYNHTALRSENSNYQWADWLSYEPLESCGKTAFRKGRPLPDALTYWNYLGACYWTIDASMMRDMAKATGRDASVYEQMVQQAREYTRTTFLREDGSFQTDIFNTMQTPALFAMRTGLVEGAALENMKNRLRANFAQHGNCLQTGFLGTPLLMPVLTDNGMADIAYELLLQRKNPSWLYSVDNGATTIWERWNSYTIESGMGPKGMNSFNHYAYGCVCQWLWESVAGIAADPDEPGFRHIIMRPLPDKRLGSMQASYRSAAGLITSEWRYEGDTWIWHFSIPEGATASVTLPGETSATEYPAGDYTLEKTDIARQVSLVTFDLNYPEAAHAPDAITVRTGCTLSLDRKPVPTREGYRFAGWYQSKDCKPSDRWLFGKKGGGFWGAASDSMAVKNDMVLYARWDKPMRISTPEQFDKIRDDLYGWYVLENDIDLSSFNRWEPIGNYDSSYEYADAEWWTNAFHGRFDGNGHTITGLHITSATGFVSSLFGALANGEICNLTVEAPVIQLRGESIYASPLLGYMKNDASGMPYLTNCHVTDADIRVSIANLHNTFSGATALVMAGWGGVVRDCSTSGRIAFEVGNLPEGGELYVGALNGECYCTTENCTADVEIDFSVAKDAVLKDVKAFVGGLQASASNMSDCAGKGTIRVQDHPGFGNLCIGGVAGSERFGAIRRCTSDFEIEVIESVNAHVGGIVGEFSAQYGMIGAMTGVTETTIENCRSTGDLPVSGNGIPDPVGSPFGGTKMIYSVK